MPRNDRRPRAGKGPPRSHPALTKAPARAADVVHRAQAAEEAERTSARMAGPGEITLAFQGAAGVIDGPPYAKDEKGAERGRDGDNAFCPHRAGPAYAPKRRRSGTRDGLSVCPISSSKATYSAASFGRSRGGPAQVVPRRHDAERTRAARHPRPVDPVRSLPAGGDDFEHLRFRQVVDRQPVEPVPPGHRVPGVQTSAAPASPRRALSSARMPMQETTRRPCCGRACR